MGAVRLLSDQLINRIAAGEVIERPAAVLKELLENSLDAEAQRLEIEAERGGCRLISVSDNGLGMSPDDLLLSVERHATSKLKEETDLLNIRTLGFRGEALPSIGAVSRMILTSSSSQDGQGQRVRLSGGRILGVEDAARDRGTTVEVQDLFFNVPARRKFLKSDQTEAAHLLEMVQRYALGRLDCRFIYRHNGQELLTASPREDLQSRLARVLGLETARAMIPFEDELDGFHFQGYLASPELARSRASGLYLYVNGRPVSDRLLTRAVIEAYRQRLPESRYPVAVVFLALDPVLVDVNVHPSKAEVRFRQPGQVFSAAVEVMTRALAKNLHPAAAPPAPMYDRIPSFPHAGLQTAERAVWFDYREQAPAGFPGIAPASIPGPAFPGPAAPETEKEPAYEAAPVWRAVRAVGQLYHSFILAQGPEGLLVVDQHAAHERILFERFLADLADGFLSSQSLLIPETLELTPLQTAGLETLLPELTQLGFELTPFGGQTYVLKAVPAILAGKDAGAALREMIDSAGDSLKKGQPAPDPGRLRETLVASLACHGSIRAGDQLTQTEMDRLLDDLFRTSLPTNCPHGRPLVFLVSRREIEKRFARV